LAITITAYSQSTGSKKFARHNQRPSNKDVSFQKTISREGTGKTPAQFHSPSLKKEIIEEINYPEEEKRI
jgi:hypothetical protein